MDGKPMWKQLTPPLYACLGGFIVGNVLGYASPATIQLKGIPLSNGTQENNSTTPTTTTIYGSPIHFSSFEIAWFSSIFGIGALAGGLGGSLLLQTAGRKGTMILGAVVALAGWLLVGLGNQFGTILIGRLLTGVYTGIACVAVVTYISETAPSAHRGLMGTIFNLLLAMGIVTAIAVGGYVNWYTLALLCSAVPVIFGILVAINTESPAFLLIKRGETEALKALHRIRGEDSDVMEEFSSMKRFHMEAQENPWKWSDISKPSVWKPFSTVVLLMVAMQLCGINAMSFNLNAIFKSTGTSLSDYTASVISSGSQAIFTLVAVVLMDRAGRRPLVIASSAAMSVSFGAIGLFFFLRSRYEEWTLIYFSWLPLGAVILYFAAFAIGIGTVPFVMLGEMLPGNFRETGSGIAIAANWTTSFLVVFSYEPLMTYLSHQFFYWLYGIICFSMTILWVFIIRETKGKTLEEIALMYNHHLHDLSSPAKESLMS